MRSSEFRWAQVRVGLFVALALFVFFAAVATLGISGSPFSRRAHLHGLFQDISGLAVGSPVEMGGVIVGEITGVDLPDLESGKVPVRIAIEKAALEKLGPSSTAFTGSHALVGQRFLGVSVRRPDEPPLKDGDEIRTVAAETTDTLVSEGRRVLDDIRAILVDVHKAVNSVVSTTGAIDEGNGTVARLVHDPELYDRLSSAARRADELTGRALDGDGTLAALLSDGKMAEDLRGTASSMAATARRVEKGEGVLGRLTKANEQSREIERTLANVELVSGRLAEAKGTLGALISDPALLGRMNTLLVEMDSLVADVRRNPERYIKLRAF
jgi:phospholipid/cholesterol/gamma-HCH transport system substrate-binding protein